ncbi:hypothetical protein [uncultured Alistipes sp.]|uniref:hypothetical protein n=2 Tax=uncultured Alistipes sp. TaxID=538949 RepID=UPI002657BFC5|nr:hypothetical protein [uncultured Alistipes sp.]
MTMENIIAVIAAVGGIEGIIHAGKWWTSRHAVARGENAKAAAAEIDNSQRQIDYYEKRLNARDAKVDALYAELRKEQAAHIDTLHRMHEVELQLREAEVRKCHKRGCADRVPPSDY